MLLLAHQGGWDEVLLILTPIAIFAALLGMANRRANVAVRQREDGGSTGSEGEPTGDAGTRTETDPEGGPPPPPGGPSAPP